MRKAKKARYVESPEDMLLKFSFEGNVYFVAVKSLPEDPAKWEAYLIKRIRTYEAAQKRRSARRKGESL